MRNPDCLMLPIYDKMPTPAANPSQRKEAKKEKNIQIGKEKKKLAAACNL